jgi:hypothetical protein
MCVRLVICLLVCAVLRPNVLTAAPRAWTDREGRTIEAELLRADPLNVVIRRTDGREFTLARTLLSAADQNFLDSIAVKPPAAPDWVAGLNEALGVTLFADDQLWDDEPKVAAERLRLPPESVTVGAESWRAYARPPLLVLDAPAYMLLLRSEEGRLTEFAMMFTNRGDAPAFAERTRRTPVSKAEVQTFQEDLKRDFARLRAGLSDLLPKAESDPTPAQRRAYPGELAIFTAGEHELILQALPDQMLTLRIHPTERAAPPRLSDEQARQRMKARVKRRETGDVVIDRIPMVNQGPKGYCVPATFERMLRYAGIPADMYELAAQGGTNFGGGTSVSGLVEALGRTVRRAGRKLEEVKVEAPSALTLARYIDEGRPVLWSLASTPEFNEFANTYSAERPSDAAALKRWAAERKKPSAGLSRDPEAGHLCLIIGYNKITGELAFSDSWGPKFAERWLPGAAVQQVSYGQLWVMGL